MAETDVKSLDALDLYNNTFDENSIIPVTVRVSGSSVTRKVYYPALKTALTGYDIIGTLTAGSTSLILSSVGSTYDEQTAYSAGARVTYTGDDEVTRNYICIKSCTAGNWETNGRYFVEYSPITEDSVVDIYTKEGDGCYVPAELGVKPTDISLANNALTLTFAAQLADILVRVVVK